MDIRVGFGYDNHRLVTGRPLIIGGITIPFEKGLQGHSDADILLHAITDALLGAANLRDIGYHFSDKDPRWKDADSQLFLREAHRMVNEKKFRISNLDCTLIAEAPKLNPFIPEMKKVISDILGLDEDRISVKAKTNEKLDAVGAGDGMAAYAVVLLISA
jgi:2-C-methyl-D-erythritol 2,4-cyclodiphosphate synthase